MKFHSLERNHGKVEIGKEERMVDGSLIRKKVNEEFDLPRCIDIEKVL